MAQLKGGTTIGGSIAYHGTNSNLSTIPWVAGTLTLGDAANTQGFLNLWGSAGDMGTIKQTTDNLHIDAAGAGRTYLNYYAGSDGVYFGNGATGTNAHVTAAGVFTGSGAGLTGTAASLTAGNATKLSTINTNFSGTYPMTVNVTGVIYSHASVTFNGTSGAITATCFVGSGAGLTGTAASLTAGNATNATTATNATCLGGQAAANYLRSNVADTKTAGNLIFNDAVCATFGSGSDLDIYHSGSHAYINNATGSIYIRPVGVENGIYVGANTCTQLYFDGAAKLKTMVGGVCVTGYNCATTCHRAAVICATTCFLSAGSTGYRLQLTAGCGCAIDFVATSDCRIKKCIEPITSALSKVDCLCGVCYELCEDDTKDMGLIAQDVLQVEPRLVSKGEPDEMYVKKYGIEDEMLGLKYNKFAGLFVEAIKELKQQVIEQQEEINNLKTKINK